MKPILYLLLLLLLLLSACSGKRYGHYSYFKRQSQKTVKQEKPRKKEIKPLTIYKLIKPKFQVDSILSKSTISQTLISNQLIKPKYKQISNNSNYHSYSLVKQKVETKTDDEPPAKPNSYADISMTLSIISLFFGLGSILYLPLILVAFALGLLAYDLSTNALDEINRFPNKYSNKNAALVGKVIGGIYLYALILAAIIVGFIILIGVVILIAFMIAAIVTTI